MVVYACASSLKHVTILILTNDIDEKDPLAHDGGDPDEDEIVGTEDGNVRLHLQPEIFTKMLIMRKVLKLMIIMLILMRTTHRPMLVTLMKMKETC